MSYDGGQESATRRLALVLEYDGTNYSGFQVQSQIPSVQAEVEQAIKCFTGHPTRVRCASRTDAGVHARGQVVDFLTQSPYPVETFVNALNFYLPLDIKVRGATQAPLDFNARRDATSRVYRYTFLNSKWPSPLSYGFAHWVPQPLDVAAMTHSAGYLLGTHDFTHFTGTLPPEKSPVRQVARWDVWREGELVFIEAEANAFLPHQIRRTNGILVEIGLGRLSIGMIKGLLGGTLNGLKHRPTVPAKGLCLVKVTYGNSPIVCESGYEA